MIEVGNKKPKNRNKDRWNYCHLLPMISLSEANHCLPLFHMAKRLICLNKKKRINEVTIGYMINTGLDVNKAFIQQVENVCILHSVKSHNLLLNPY